MTAIDPRTLRPGDWFTCSVTDPPRYRVDEIDNECVIAYREDNLTEGRGGRDYSTLIPFDGKTFERVPVPKAFRRPLPTDVGVRIVAELKGGRITVAELDSATGSYGPQWAETGSGEWLTVDEIIDWRLLDGIDTVRPDGGAK